MTDLGERIRARRRELGLSQGKLAQMADITASAISQIESGAIRTLKNDTLSRLAVALQTTALELMAGLPGETGAALPAALALAQQLAQGPEVATARIKTLCRVAHHHSLEEQLALEADYMVEAQGSEESLEGIGAFLEKRAPDFARLRSAE